ncbi:methyl-accepting chemotaxis protein [Metabacillus litoralis]|uniref:methyl-accepting chemotaxis protein n=1 Tax=Metabacillus litoralis TaxID=152268 RepID=UPI001CFE8E80|nr:methyl-accepting chemotaxis protein [Metabacillus litoralis]
MKKSNIRGQTSLKMKLTILCMLLLAIPSLTIGIMGYSSSKKNLDELGATNLQNNVKMAIKLIESVNKEVEDGVITLEEGQERVKALLTGEKQADGKRPIDKTINMGENGYFFVMNNEGVLIAHPSSEGKDLTEMEDPNGVNVGNEILGAAKSGSGFAYYEWPLPNDPDKIEPKVTYAEEDPNWGWVISAGTYMIDFNKVANPILHTLLITLGLSLLIGSIIVWLVLDRAIAPIKKIANEMSLVADGVLTVDHVHVKSNDEVKLLAESYNKMVVSFKQLIQHVVQTTEHVTTSSEQLKLNALETKFASEQIAKAQQEVAYGAEEQASKVVHSANISQHISKDVEAISQQVETASNASQIAYTQASKGEVNLKKVVDQMTIITTNTEETGRAIQLLNKKSSEIERIVSLINDIATQTNLLALNAAIEAARAGEHGKGFAVVADEVRKLAEQSSLSTHQINELITEIQNYTIKAVESMQQGERAVKAGTEIVNNAGVSFKEIAGTVKQVVTQMDEVTNSIDRIQTGTENLVESIESVNEITERTSESTGEVSAATEEQLALIEEINGSAGTMHVKANELIDLVRKFKI